MFLCGRNSELFNLVCYDKYPLMIAEYKFSSTVMLSMNLEEENIEAYISFFFFLKKNLIYMMFSQLIIGKDIP
jgi:hypothetical protein